MNETRVTGLVTPLSVTRSRGRRYASALFLKRSRRTQVLADFGDQTIAGEQSFILGIGDVSITAKNILNKGADISGASLNLNANEDFLNEAKRVGRVSFHQVCRLFCRVSGDADLRFVGGTITASKSLTVAAAGKLNNLSGTISGTSGVTISAPMTKFEPLFSPQKIEQPVGLLGGFRGQRGALSGGYSYGTLQSAAGDISIDGDADIGGADLTAAGTIIVTGSRVKSVEPEPLYKVERRTIGLVWNIFK